MPHYNHAFALGFTVVSMHDEENVTAEELFAGIERRLAELRRNPDDIVEACGLPFDTFIEE